MEPKYRCKEYNELMFPSGDCACIITIEGKQVWSIIVRAEGRVTLQCNDMRILIPEEVLYEYFEEIPD